MPTETKTINETDAIVITTDELRRLRLLSTKIISWLPSSPQVSELVNLLIEIEDRNIQ